MLYDLTYRSNSIKHQYFLSINPQCHAEWRELPLPPSAVSIRSVPSLTGWTGVTTKQPEAFKHSQTRHILQPICSTALMCGGTEMKQRRDTQRTENNEGETHTAFTVEDIESVEDVYN